MEDCNLDDLDYCENEVSEDFESSDSETVGSETGDATEDEGSESQDGDDTLESGTEYVRPLYCAEGMLVPGMDAGSDSDFDWMSCLGQPCDRERISDSLKGASSYFYLTCNDYGIWETSYGWGDEDTSFSVDEGTKDVESESSDEDDTIESVPEYTGLDNCVEGMDSGSVSDHHWMSCLGQPCNGERVGDPSKQSEFNYLTCVDGIWESSIWVGADDTGSVDDTSSIETSLATGGWATEWSGGTDGLDTGSNACWQEALDGDFYDIYDFFENHPCEGQSCNSERRIPLNRGEKSASWFELACVDGIWTVVVETSDDWGITWGDTTGTWYSDDPTETFENTETGSEYDCFEDTSWDYQPDKWKACVGKPCSLKSGERSSIIYSLSCVDGIWETSWEGVGYTDGDYTDTSGTETNGLENFSDTNICFEICERKILGDKDGWIHASSEDQADFGVCYYTCIGPLDFGTGTGGATDGETDSGPIDDSDTPETTIETTTRFLASGTFTTTEEFVTTLTPIATTTSEFASTTVAPSACDEERTHECPRNSYCVRADNFVTFTCQCKVGYYMSGNMCHKKAPEAESCPEDFKKDLFKMKLDGLNNPKYYLNKGSVMIQVESQVVSRFRIRLD